LENNNNPAIKMLKMYIYFLLIRHNGRPHSLYEHFVLFCWHSWFIAWLPNKARWIRC